LWLAMRRDDLWTQAGAFRPERWLGGTRPNPNAWIPFGGGVRRCTGAPFAEMEVRAVLRAAAEVRLRPVRPEGVRARRTLAVGLPPGGLWAPAGIPWGGTRSPVPACTGAPRRRVTRG